jgi:glycosyltransferase involved in cell wall biosynthesis
LNILNVLKFTPDSGGGVAKHLKSLGIAANKSGHKLFLGFDEKRNWHSELETVAQILIIPEIKYPVRSGFPGVLRKICMQYNIDVVHLHFHFSLPFSLALSFRSWNLPMLYHWHNPPLALNNHFTPINTIKGKIKRQISGLVARFTDLRIIDKHIAISKEISSLLVKNQWTKKDKISYVPNGITLTLNNNNFLQKRTSDTTIIGSVSNFREQKDHLTLVRAFNIVSRENSECELWLVGDGETKSDIRKLTKEFGIESRVRFMGTVSDISEMYKQFDVFALSSHNEGHSLVILEAMSFGLPIVATRISSIPETIEHKVNGLLVNHQDPEDLAKALIKLITDKNLRNKLGAEAKKTSEKQPIVDHWAKNILHIYKECLAKS